MQMSVNGITNNSNSYQMAFQWAFFFPVSEIWIMQCFHTWFNTALALSDAYQFFECIQGYFVCIYIILQWNSILEIPSCLQVALAYSTFKNPLIFHLYSTSKVCVTERSKQAICDAEPGGSLMDIIMNHKNESNA